VDLRFTQCGRAGPAPCIVLAFITKGAKTQENGRKSISTTIRHKDPVLCPHNSLEHQHWMRFTFGGEVFPVPDDPKRWRSEVVWPANDRTCNVSYQQQHQAISDYLTELEIPIKKSHMPFGCWECGCSITSLLASWHLAAGQELLRMTSRPSMTTDLL